MKETEDAEILTLDFTAPESSYSGAEESTQSDTLPSNIADLLKQATSEVESSIRNLELALESGLVDENIWQLLAYLYLGTSRIDKLGNLDRQYEETFGRTFSSIFSQQKIRINSNRTVFEMPQKIVHASLPDIVSVQKACISPEGAILDFSRVHGADTNGLKELIKFFSQLPHDQTRPELKGDERFISSLEKAAEGTTGTQEMWDMLFEYKRFCNDIDAFDRLAIKFAMRFDISPPSW